MTETTATTATRERPINLKPWEARAILDGRKTQLRRIMKPQPTRPYALAPWCLVWKKQEHFFAHTFPQWAAENCPFGKPGDILWGREAFYADTRDPLTGPNPAIIYAATPELAREKMRPDVIRCALPHEKPVSRAEAAANLEDHRFQRLRSSTHMPRWASRITLEIAEVRVQQIREISEADAEAEGIGVSSRAVAPGDELRMCVACGRPRDSHVGSARVCFGRSSVYDDSTFRGGFCHRWDIDNGPGAWGRNDWVWAVTFRRIDA